MMGQLDGVRVIDASTLFAGPLAAMHLGDLGAEVIKVENPRRPDGSRGHGPSKDGHNLWWKTLGRNKRTVGIDLGTPGGQEVFTRLAASADIVIENFRPDTLETWGLGYDVLSAENPGLILARITGFGQVGPMRRRAGFGTLAEAMSGFASLTGEPDGPPTLPAFGLADGVTSLTAAFALATALFTRERTGRGQVIDLAIVEPLMAILGPQVSRFDQMGTVQPRTGNRSSNNAPRNIYPTADGSWVAVSTSSQSIAERVLTLVGHPEVCQEPWFAAGATRAEHADELDALVGGWIAARPRDVVIEEFTRAQAAIAPIYTAADIVAEEQFAAIGAIRRVEDPDLGPLLMAGGLFRSTEGDAEIAFTGRPPGADTDAVLGELGLTADELAALRTQGAVA
jgi:crotonobetainyl-CoA:carnitine CoA-transferase CaiB-like acyl-CoA transferase